MINHGAFMTNSPEIVVTISANDLDTGVASYFISESPMTPTAGTPGWVDVTPALKFGATVPFILSMGDGQKTIYVWFKDVGNNISTPASATILINTSGYLCVSKWGSREEVRPCCTAANSWRPSMSARSISKARIFAADNGNNRVQKFDNTGNFIILWGNFGSANSNFHNPTGIARCEGRCLCRRYQQSSGSEVRRQARRVHHEIRFARER